MGVIRALNRTDGRPPMLTPEQAASFRETGILAIRHALASSEIAPVRDYVRGELARLGVTGRGKRSVVRDLPPFQQVTRLSSLLRFAGLGDRLITPALRRAIAELAGGVRLTPSEAQLLVSPPRQGAWSLDGAGWHVAVAASTTLVTASR